MLESIDTRHGQHTSQICQTVTKAPAPIPLWPLEFAGDSENSTVFTAPIMPLGRAEEQVRLERMKRRLNSHCKGLLEVQRHVPLTAAGIEYLHRTVRDFLHEQSTWTMLEAMAGEPFNAERSLCRALLMRLKSLPINLMPTLSHESVVRGRIGLQCMEHLVICFVEYAKKVHIEAGDAQLELFDEIAATVHVLVT
jgi:hypothetical protein